MPVVGMSRVTRKGQVTIPRAVREQLQLEAGDQLEWQSDAAGHVVVRKLTRRLEDLIGMLGERTRPLSVEQMDEAIRARMKKAHARR